MVTYYCTSCWHESQNDIIRCPNCGASSAYCSEKTYADILIRCLTHPVRDYRLIAVQILGKIKYAPAEPYLVSIIHSEQDHEIIQEAENSIRKIHGYQNHESIPYDAKTRSESINNGCGLVIQNS